MYRNKSKSRIRYFIMTRLWQKLVFDFFRFFLTGGGKAKDQELVRDDIMHTVLVLEVVLLGFNKYWYYTIKYNITGIINIYYVCLTVSSWFLDLGSCKTPLIFVSVFLLISRITHNSNRNTRFIRINIFKKWWTTFFLTTWTNPRTLEKGCRIIRTWSGSWPQSWTRYTLLLSYPYPHCTRQLLSLPCLSYASS